MAEKFKSKWANNIVTPKGQFVFPKLFTPDIKSEKNKYGDGKHKVTLLLTPEAAKDLNKEALKLAREQWGDKATPKTIELPAKSGDGKKYEFMHGMYTLIGKTKTKPFIVDRQKNDLEEGELNAGDWGRLAISLFTYENTKEVEREDAEGNIEIRKKTVRGVTCKLEGVQHVEVGDPSSVGGQGTNKNIFDDVEDDDDDDEDVVVTGADEEDEWDD